VRGSGGDCGGEFRGCGAKSLALPNPIRVGEPSPVKTIEDAATLP
jgi:hypothetical protein